MRVFHTAFTRIALAVLCSLAAFGCVSNSRTPAEANNTDGPVEIGPFNTYVGAVGPFTGSDRPSGFMFPSDDSLVLPDSVGGNTIEFHINANGETSQDANQRGEADAESSPETEVDAEVSGNKLEP